MVTNGISLYYDSLYNQQENSIISADWSKRAGEEKQARITDAISLVNFQSILLGKETNYLWGLRYRWANRESFSAFSCGRPGSWGTMTCTIPCCCRVHVTTAATLEPASITNDFERLTAMGVCMFRINSWALYLIWILPTPFLPPISCLPIL